METEQNTNTLELNQSADVLSEPTTANLNRQLWIDGILDFASFLAIILLVILLFSQLKP